MDPAFFTAFAALAGTAIGGFTSLTTSWLTQRSQFRAEQLKRDLDRREELYKGFIEEAATLYADACECEGTEPAKLVKLFALISMMRVRSAPEIVECADRVGRMIIQTYREPNKTFREVAEALDSEAVEPLRAFSIACREELHR